MNQIPDLLCGTKWHQHVSPIIGGCELSSIHEETKIHDNWVFFFTLFLAVN